MITRKSHAFFQTKRAVMRAMNAISGSPQPAMRALYRDYRECLVAYSAANERWRARAEEVARAQTALLRESENSPERKAELLAQIEAAHKDAQFEDDHAQACVAEFECLAGKIRASGRGLAA